MSPGCNDRASWKNGGIGGVAEHGGCAAGEVAIVDNECTTSDGNVGSLAVRGNDTLGCSDKLAVLDNNRSDGLVGRTVGHVDTDTAIVDGQRFEMPQPVPIHEYGGVTIVECQVAGGKLLISEKHPVVASIKSEIGHPAT